MVDDLLNPTYNLQTLLKNGVLNDTIREAVSKFSIDPAKLTVDTLPNPVVLGGLKEIGIKKLTPMIIPKYLLNHPAVPRGIELKVNRMIRLLNRRDIGKNIFPINEKNKMAIEAAEYCTAILAESIVGGRTGPIRFIKQFAKNAFSFGDGFATLSTNRSGKEVLLFKMQHPIFFGAAKYPANYKIKALANKMKVIPATGAIEYYTQFKKKADLEALWAGNMYDDSDSPVQTPEEIKLEPFGKEIPNSKVMQLNFDTLGDGALGIPIMQTLHYTVGNIMKVEDAGVQTMINFGFNRWIAHTPFKTKPKMQSFGRSISNIKKRSTIIVPDGVKIENVQPYSTDFDKVETILLKLIAMRLGISRILLEGEGADINKSTLSVLVRDMQNDFFADELEIETAINDGFDKACKLKYGSKFNLAPRFMFNELPEDKDDVLQRELKESMIGMNWLRMFQIANDGGKQSEANSILKHYLNSQNIINND